MHAVHFQNILREFYDIDLDEWVVCSIADNTSKNHKVARILNKAHVGCQKHLLNLDIRQWISGDRTLDELVESITSVMKQAKTLKNTAKLQKFTMLTPILNNKTRWSGIRLMLDQFICIRTELIAVADLYVTNLKQKLLVLIIN